jgi:hypothetical protein
MNTGQIKTESENVIEEMLMEAYRLMESSRSPNGTHGKSAQSIALRNLSYKLQDWAKMLRSN